MTHIQRDNERAFNERFQKTEAHIDTSPGSRRLRWTRSGALSASQAPTATDRKPRKQELTAGSEQAIMATMSVVDRAVVPDDLVRRIAERFSPIRSSFSALARAAMRVRTAISICSCCLRTLPIQTSERRNSMRRWRISRANGHRRFDYLPFRALPNVVNTVTAGVARRQSPL